MKDGMKQYAFKSGKIKENYLRKHKDGGSGRKAYEASRHDRLQQSRQEQKEEVAQVPGNSGQLDQSVTECNQLEFGRAVTLTEDVVFIDEENTTANNQEVVSLKKEGRKPKKKAKK